MLSKKQGVPPPVETMISSNSATSCSLGEDLTDSFVESLLDEDIQVDEGKSQKVGQVAPEGCFSGSHVASKEYTLHISIVFWLQT